MLHGLLAGGFCVSCASEEQWSFGLTRAVYEDGVAVNAPAADAEPYDGGAEQMGMLALLVLPIALDLVLLPVALSRDLIVLGT